jgi:hypothetical protein
MGEIMKDKLRSAGIPDEYIINSHNGFHVSFDILDKMVSDSDHENIIRKLDYHVTDKGLYFGKL